MPLPGIEPLLLGHLDVNIIRRVKSKVPPPDGYDEDVIKFAA